MEISFVTFYEVKCENEKIEKKKEQKLCEREKKKKTEKLLKKIILWNTERI